MKPRGSAASVAGLLEGFHVSIGQANPAAHVEERAAKPNAIRRPHGGLQNDAHLRLRAATVFRRPQFQGSMRFMREIADRDGRHDSNSS